MMTMSKKSKGVVAAMIAAGALGAGTASASAATTYTSSSATQNGTLTGGPAIFTVGNIVVRCTTSTATVNGLSTTPQSLPRTFGMDPRPSFSSCIGTIAGLQRPTTVTTSGTWTATLAASPNYSGTFNVPAGGAVVAVGTCNVVVGATSVPANLRVAGALGTVPALGTATNRLTVNGSVPVSYTGTGCPTAATGTFVADGSAVGGTTTGTYGLSGTITEN